MTGVSVRGSTAVVCGSFAQRASSPVRFLLLSFAALALLSAGSIGRAGAASPADATSSPEARDDATRRIPWNRLPEAQRRDVEFVVKNTSIYRRLPTRVVDCDPDLFTFLLQRPDVVVNVWQLMGIS